MEINIINNNLRWDGSHLGVYSDIVTNNWLLEGTKYMGIALPYGWLEGMPGGMTY